MKRDRRVVRQRAHNDKDRWDYIREEWGYRLLLGAIALVIIGVLKLFGVID